LPHSRPNYYAASEALFAILLHPLVVHPANFPRLSQIRSGPQKAYVQKRSVTAAAVSFTGQISFLALNQ